MKEQLEYSQIITLKLRKVGRNNLFEQNDNAHPFNHIGSDVSNLSSRNEKRFIVSNDI